MVEVFFTSEAEAQIKAAAKDDPKGVGQLLDRLSEEHLPKPDVHRLNRRDAEKAVLSFRFDQWRVVFMENWELTPPRRYVIQVFKRDKPKVTISAESEVLQAIVSATDTLPKK